MTWPETNSRFPGKCTECGKEFKAGEKIYKINETYWCADANCQGKSSPPPADPNPPNLDSNYKDVHDEVWAFAIEEARKIYPVLWKKVPGNEAGVPEKRIDINLRERMIVAEVFYKKLMDWHIHRTT